MQLTTHDIAERRERVGRTALWLSERLLIEELKITEQYLRQVARPSYAASVSPAKKDKDILPDTGKSWRYARLKGAFYYDYDRLPANRREALPGKETLLRLAQQNDLQTYHNHLKSQVEAILNTDFQQYLHLYRGYDDDHAHTLAKGCAVLMFAADTLRNGGADSATAFLNELANVLNLVGCEYLPKHWRRLKEKVDTILKGVPVQEVMKLKREGNQNAARLNDEEVKSWLLQMRNMPANYTNAFIIRKLRLMCTLAEKRVPSKSWFELELAKPLTKFLTTARFGSGKLGDKWKGYIPIENALHSGDCWMMDGTRANMIAFRNAEGKEEFLYWLACYDVHSGDLLGLHFDTKEDRWGYLNALKMSVSTTGYLPYEIVIDRFPGHNTEEIELLIKRLERLGVKVTITSKKTGKSKLERFFETFQSVFMAESPWYYGEGVQSSRTAAHRSPEYLKAQTKRRNNEQWDFNAAWSEMLRLVSMYRDTPLAEYSEKCAGVAQSPRQLHEASDRPHSVKVEPWDAVELFGLEKTVTIRHGGLIKTDIQKVEYFYRVDEYTTLSEHTKVRLCYDMEDLTTVYLYADSDEINRQYLGTATEQRRAQLYGPDADMSGIGKGKEKIAAIEAARKEHFKVLTQVADDGDEVDILLAGLAQKGAKSNAETAWLHERTAEWKPTEKNKPRLLDTEEADELDEDTFALVPNAARKQY